MRLLNHFSIGEDVQQTQLLAQCRRQLEEQGLIRNVVDCNVNFPNVSFRVHVMGRCGRQRQPSSPMTASKDDPELRPRWPIPSNSGMTSRASAPTASANRISRVRRPSVKPRPAPERPRSPEPGSSFASFLLGDDDSGATETVRYLAQTYQHHVCMPRTTENSKAAMVSISGCVTNLPACVPRAISIRISRRTSPIPAAGTPEPFASRVTAGAAGPSAAGGPHGTEP